MNFPSEFGSFAEPTLLAAMDSVQAKLFLAEGNDIKPIETLEPAPGEAFFERVSEHLKEKLDEGVFSRLALAVPEDMGSELEDSLHIALFKVTDVILPKLLTNQEPVDIAVEFLDAIEGS